MAKLLDEIHPGEILLEDFMKPMRIVSGMGARFWVNLQAEYDIRVATRELTAKLTPRIRVYSPSAA
jgi:plasmid maintenance system antidote protein VapI